MSPMTPQAGVGVVASIPKKEAYPPFKSTCYIGVLTQNFLAILETGGACLP